MPDNTQVNTGTGDSIRGKERGTVKTQIVGLDVGIAGSAELLALGRSDGTIRATGDPTSLLYDTFETLDTVNTWTVGGTVTPSGANGVASLSAGTAANATSFARSQPSFHPGSNAFLQYASIVQLSAAAQTGFVSWWGLGVLTTPTTTVPVTNGAVYEIGTDGLLYGRVYSGGAKTNEVALTRPTDGGPHRYAILYRASRVWFNLDGAEVGSIAYPTPAISALPASMGTVNAGTALGAAAVINITLVGLADTAGGNMQISDGTFPWRQAVVDNFGRLSVNGASRVQKAIGLVTFRGTVGVTADAATAGKLWLINPVGNTVNFAVRRAEFSSAPTAATAFITSPQFTLERFTFTGTASGAVVTPVVKDTTEPALTGSVRTATTGLALTAGAAAYSFTVVPILTAVGASYPVLQEYEPAEEARIILRPGQGVVLRQAGAGTTADTRTYTINLSWEEF